MNKTVVLFLLALLPAVAQETFPVNDVQDQRARAYAFTNATIYLDYKTKLEGATLLIRDRVIEAVGSDQSVPEGYQVVDLQGKYLYPSFIDSYTSYGMPAQKRPERGFRWGRAEQIQSNTPGAYNANQAIKSEFQASAHFSAKEKDADELRKLGFGAVNIFRADGIARGTSALVGLGNDGDNIALIQAQAAAHYAFNKGSSTQTWPTSLMGFIALIRQTSMDATWYAAQDPKPFHDNSLEAWNAQQTLPQIIEARDWLSVLRADKLGDDLGLQYIVRSAGDGYRRTDALKKTGASLIVPLNFPNAMDVDDPYDAQAVSLRDMKHWELAPTNPAALEKAGIDFALTTDLLGKKSAFMTHLRKAIKHGLSEETALRALTEVPARLLKVEHRIGSLAPGKLANFLVTTGPIFGEKTVIRENWVQGRCFILNRAEDHAGTYALKIGEQSFNLEISGDPGKHAAAIPMASGEAKEGETKAADIKAKIKFTENLVSLSFRPAKEKGSLRLSGWREGKDLVGQGELADGSWVSWRAVYQGPLAKKDKAKGKGKGKGRSGRGKGKPDAAVASGKETMGQVSYPFMPYGYTTPPKDEPILISNATVWTNESEGILKNADVLVQDGKIIKIGKGLRVKRARTIDGTGKHLTAGIIDEHSHIALNGTNDSATNSSMVRMQDVVNSEHMGIYRNLAGGVTASQLLHGSANPIGGQSAMVKMRWGSTPQEMLIKGADGFIKFALGENVKRSRAQNSIRYPQTRMGVEQVMVDAFSQARDYERLWQAYEQGTAPMPRRDLVLETMVEILNGKRFITCHSYVQSEINMLMKVAEQFDFRVNTFTHILEGYKVADKMKAHGVGGSTFSDWWAYKWEVRYAIPYNAALMHDEGVVVAINSDNAEMARRLNQEAAKSVKYGGMSEEDALKLVTLNPAKLLHLDDRMGSVKEGKDGDLVLWSANPLSIYAKAEYTLVDGIIRFDLESDKQKRREISAERTRLIQKLRDHKKGGGATTRPSFRSPRERTCDDMDVYGQEWEVNDAE